ncbi:hypothetical protein GBA52_015274 [Prunus armeniaca]|nr:hypothetical protein GBA52_015274 [Prunus armeniaca]
MQLELLLEEAARSANARLGCTKAQAGACIFRYAWLLQIAADCCQLLSTVDDCG